MLYDPKWEVEIKSDPFSFASLVTWLEAQDPSTCYSTMTFSTCLLGKFASAMGAPNPADMSLKLGDDPSFAAVAFPYCLEKSTFGDAFDRARRVLARK